MKISLLKPKKDPGGNDYILSLPVRKSLPFWKSKQGQYVHRIRDGVAMWRKDWEEGRRYSHTAFHLWCGMTGFAAKGTLMASPDSNDVVCATCEGRAIGAGMTNTRMIAGHFVKFSPRL